MIRLRSIEEEDLAQLRDWRNAPEILDRCREYRLLNMQDQYFWHERMTTDPTILMYGIECNKGALIGVCGLTNIHWVNRTAELSIYIGDNKHQRKGHGIEAVNSLLGEAFCRLNLKRVWVEVYAFNQPGLKLFDKCGFKAEGHMRNHVWYQNKYYDAHIMGILVNEWEEMNEF